MPPPPPALLDELVEEILLHLPPDEPASLLRASLVCKRWRRRLSDPRFLRRYRELHGAPPMLGIICTMNELRQRGSIYLVARFVSNTGFRPSPVEIEGFSVLDCRHGRVLLHYQSLFVNEKPDLVVWDPLTGSQRRLRQPDVQCETCNAAVHCAAAEGCSCDHGDCSGGPFRIIFVCTDTDKPGVALAFAYSSVTGEWSAPASLPLGADNVELEEWPGSPGVLVGDALYFLLAGRAGVLKYDLGRHCLSVIQLPMPTAADNFHYAGPYLVAANDGVLGLAFNNMFTLKLWSMEACRDGVATTWAHHRVIHLNTLLPTEDPAISLEIATFVEGTHMVIVITDLDYYTIDLKSLRSMKLKLPESERKSMRPTGRRKCFGIFPYMRFYHPPGRLVYHSTDADEPDNAGLGLRLARN
ncbi:uncharacterized protein LOC100825544 [Brachypodium distachyon]|uniref:F-box domain-containing protein n=1 Tax=Brachypodium distachyon TaxID=15368 RepID=I1IG84_BRADI|nr:uncharacterized protein LOC100825544 [Brachypodium distachyon]KQJ85700.1 hypothetical protein BRADI_4g01110v3 [Brachypodium distachyon]|eukprot:XP_010236983.1 uncharacterized protein LOC100825544 [Brachypodium distachyon]